MPLDLLVDVAELGVPVRVLRSFEGLGVALEAEPVLPQQLAGRRCRDRMPLPGQLIGQVPQRLGRPPQRRHRIAPLVGLVQRQQGRQQLRILLRGPLTSPALPSHPPSGQRLLAAFQLGHTLADGGLADPGRLRDGAHAAMAQQPGLSCQRQTLLTFVQMREQHLESNGKPATDLARDAHTRSASPESGSNTLFPSSFNAPGNAAMPSRGGPPRSPA